MLSEIGTDVSRWPTETPCTAWLTRAPQHKVSGGRRLSSRTQPSANRAAAMFRMAALSGVRGQTALGAFYRRLAVRVGTPKALTATARTIAILVYPTLRGTLTYHDPGDHTYNARHRHRLLRRLRTQAETLGFTLLNRETGEVLEGTVS